MMSLRFMTEAGMREGFRQQKRVAKFVADPFFQGCHIPAILNEFEESLNAEARCLSALINLKRGDHIQRPLQYRIVRRRLFR
jgi:hypothetical protein